MLDDLKGKYLVGETDVIETIDSSKANKSEMAVSTSGDKTTITLKSGTSAQVLNSHQDISGKANKSEMSVSSSGDTTTITLKTGTSATVLKSHQSLSDYVKGPSTSTDAHVATFNGTGGKTIKDSGFTIGKSVPSDAKFTDTTYESKSAASGGTAVSLVTTGEKYTWNNKGSYSKPSGGIPASDLASAVQTSLGKADSALQASDIYNGLDKTTTGSALDATQGKALNDAINAISEIVTYSGTVPTYGGNVSAYKQGRVCYVRISALGTVSNIPSGALRTVPIGIPESFYPVTSCPGMLNFSGSQDHSSQFFCRLENGNLIFYCYSTVTSGDVAFTYITV